MPDKGNNVNDISSSAGPRADRLHAARLAFGKELLDSDGSAGNALEAALESATTAPITNRVIRAIRGIDPTIWEHEAREIARAVLAAAGFEVTE